MVLNRGAQYIPISNIRDSPDFWPFIHSKSKNLIYNKIINVYKIYINNTLIKFNKLSKLKKWEIST